MINNLKWAEKLLQSFIYTLAPLAFIVGLIGLYFTEEGTTFQRGALALSVLSLVVAARLIGDSRNNTPGTLLP